MPASDAGFHFIQDFRRCKRYWYNKYVRRLEPLQRSPALIFGESGHDALETYYAAAKEGIPYHERGAILKQTFLDKLHERKDRYTYHDKYEEDLNRAEFVSDAYTLQYSMEGFTPLAIEESINVTLPNGQPFTGRIDLVVRSRENIIYIVDHKFTGWSLNSFAKTVENSDQATAYLMLWNETHPELKATAVIFNIIREYKGNVNFLRPVVSKTQRDVEDFKLDLMDDQNDITRRLTDPDARWPKNTESCFLYNRPCPFLDLCKGQNYEGLIGVKFEQKDQLEQLPE